MTATIIYPAHPFIMAWGRRMGSSVSYTSGECARAKADDAPARAIYRDSDGHWYTVDDVSNQDALDFITDYVRERWPGHPALYKAVTFEEPEPSKEETSEVERLRDALRNLMAAERACAVARNDGGYVRHPVPRALQIACMRAWEAAEALVEPPAAATHVETRAIENGVKAKISVTRDGCYLVAVFGTDAIPMAASAVIEKRGVGWETYDRINQFINRCFNVSRMFPDTNDEANRANNLRAIEKDYEQ